MTELYEYLKIIIVNDHVRHKLSFINVKMQVCSGSGCVLKHFYWSCCQFSPIQKCDSDTFGKVIARK